MNDEVIPAYYIWHTQRHEAALWGAKEGSEFRGSSEATETFLMEVLLSPFRRQFHLEFLLSEGESMTNSSLFVCQECGGWESEGQDAYSTVKNISGFSSRGTILFPSGQKTPDETLGSRLEEFPTNLWAYVLGTSINQMFEMSTEKPHCISAGVERLGRGARRPLRLTLPSQSPHCIAAVTHITSQVPMTLDVHLCNHKIKYGTIVSNPFADLHRGTGEAFWRQTS